MKTDTKTDTLWKTYLVYFLILAFGIAIITKIILVQTKDNSKLLEQAEKREYKMFELEVKPPSLTVSMFVMVSFPPTSHNKQASLKKTLPCSGMR